MLKLARLIHRKTIGCFMLGVLLASSVFAQTTAFTYQGRLTDGGSPANGLYDMQFKLFDLLSGGAMQGSPQTLSNVTVTNGVFTVQLDFGSSVFTTNAGKFLEIGVKNAGGPSFTTLPQRQPVNATPYAIKTLSATSADGLSAACVACVADAQVSSNVVLKDATQALTNKTINSTTNSVTTDKLRTATNEVDVKTAAAPSVGQVLTATSSTAATWQTPANVWTLTAPSINASGALVVNGTSGSGGPVTSAGQTWIAAPNTAGTNSLTATGFLGTSSNNHVDLVTNNIVRGRLTNLGEFFIGATNTTISGDLLGGVSNATFPWAVNGYSSFNGSGVYGSIQAGTTNFAAVQGEYAGTSVNGAGVRGIAINAASVGVYGVENTGTGWAGYFTGNVNVALPFAYFNLSDKRLKKNEKVIANAVAKLQQLNGYEYDLNVEEYPRYVSKQAHRIGVIAQEVEKVFPDLVIEKYVPASHAKFSRAEDDTEQTGGQRFKSVNYDGLIPVLIEAVKEQQRQIEDLKKLVEQLSKAKN